MHKRAALALWLTACSAFVVSQPASAQGLGGSASGLSTSIFKLMNQVGATAAQNTGTQGTGPAPKAGQVPGAGQSPKAAPTSVPAPLVKPAALTFKVSPQVRQKAINTFVAQISQASPESGAEWNKLFKGGDVFAEIDKQVKTMFGLSTTNLADTWAVYWSYAWLMTQSRTDDPTKAQAVGLRNQFQPLLLSIPAVAAYTDAQKQEMSDTLLLQVVLFGTLAEAWKDDQASRDEFGAGLKQGTRELGLDLGSVALTDQGFRVNK